MSKSPPPTTAVVLRPDDDVLAASALLYGATPGDRIAALATALASSPPWQRLRRNAALVVRPEPVPLLAVVGRVAQSDEALLQALGWQIEDSLTRLLPVSYADVESGCERLASRLRERLGEDLLGECAVLGMPRGGLIVAGMLAYCLGLRSSQVVSHPTDRADPLLVVDDCMLSGARTRRWLRSNTGPPVVLAHLHSHPALRAAAERDPRVRACVAAVDLHDHAPDKHGTEYPTWRQRWQERSPDDYWTGHPDHVCYPWNEPDTLVWNEATGVPEAGWHVVPPAWCLKNRQSWSIDEVQTCATSPGSRHVPASVLWADLGDSLVLVDVDAGASIALEGTGKDFWRALLAASDLEDAVRSIADLYRVSTTTVAPDLQSFAHGLAVRGLWQPPTSGRSHLFPGIG